MGGDPAVPGQAAGVVVDDDNQAVLLLAGVAEDADHLVAVAEYIGVEVALGGLDRADVRSPGRPGNAAVHQRKRCLLRLQCLPGRAKTGNTGQQGQSRRAALLGGIADQALANQLLDVGPAPRTAPTTLLAPPGAQQLADHELGVERATDCEQLAGGLEHLGEQGVWRRPGEARGPVAPSRPWSGLALLPPVACGISTSTLGAHSPSFADFRAEHAMPRHAAPPDFGDPR